MGSSPLSDEEISALLQASQQLLTSRYVTMSAICLSVYDVVVNLDREVKYVWKAEWSISKIFFLFGRYYGLIYNIIGFAVSIRTDLSLGVCKVWLWYDILGGAMLFGPFVNVILTMRLYAVYQNRNVMMMLIFLIICESALEVYSCVHTGFQTTRNVMVIPESAGILLPGCITQIDLHITLFAWIPCMIVATVFFTMTIVKAKSEGWTTPRKLRDLSRISPLIVVIIRDGALFYCMIIVVMVISSVLSVGSANAAAGIPQPWTVVVYSLTASRLVLNLREEANRQRHGDAASLTLEPIIFAPNAVNRTEVVERPNTRFGDNEGSLDIARYSGVVEEPLTSITVAMNRVGNKDIEISP